MNTLTKSILKTTCRQLITQVIRRIMPKAKKPEPHKAPKIPEFQRRHAEAQARGDFRKPERQ